ncbi:hypothetical protein COM45_04845 [Corynebacterium accolens]|uniref:Uncharacterized protein n=1 Tax=Corynebacterium accolens TaxID=38284 RepID=A0A2A4ALQ1_9CORY|nr:hypothetical protein COM45_04845 [Corynebacterium accolens]
MSKWKVRRENTIFFHPDEDDVCYGPRWCITSPTGVSWGNKATFAEAIAYADKRARTREYVLPRRPLPLSLPGIADDDALIYVTNGKNGCVYLKDEDHSETLTLYARELRPLALALLAHTERMGQ